jgi:hypothetical protein
MIITLFVSLVRSNLENAACVWFVRFALRSFHWTVNPAYDSRCALLGLEFFEDRRTMISALFILDLLCNVPIFSAPLKAAKYRFQSKVYRITSHALTW